MVGECDRPKKEDPPPTKGISKGDRGKSRKGKFKGKRGDTGKRIPKVNPEEITPKPSEAKSEETLKQEQKPKELIFDSKKELSEFEK